MTIEEIRQDLKDIRYYYEMMELFKNTAKIIPPIATVQKVEKYNKVVEKAPIKLYILYVSLYVNKCIFSSPICMYLYITLIFTTVPLKS